MASPLKVQPAALVIYGATGDLTSRKLIPALYHLFAGGILAEPLIIIGFARREWSDRVFREKMQQAVKKHAPEKYDTKTWKNFAKMLFYHRSDFNDNLGYDSLVKKLAKFEEKLGVCLVRIHYFAAPPSTYATVSSQLGRSGLSKGCQLHNGQSRVVVEKPFGRDFDSAVSLNEAISEAFQESQIYRIDHFLGKETVQNIFAFRFANSVYEPIWNKEYVDHVQITAAETLGVEHRGGYYEEAGALRDMVQNHFMQLISLVAMQQPPAFNAEDFRNEKIKVIKNIVKPDPDHVDELTVRGQYDAGEINAKRVAAYRDEKRVAGNSLTETFVAAKLEIKNELWQGVPFYIRTGKRLSKNVTEITLQFKKRASVFSGLQPNILTLRLGPNEGIALQIMTKKPGFGLDLVPSDMSFCYHTSFKERIADAYERLLLDIFQGDQMLFARMDEVEASWQIIDSIVEGWARMKKPKFPNYKAGSWGPDASFELLARDGREWWSERIEVCPIHG